MRLCLRQFARCFRRVFTCLKHTFSIQFIHICRPYIYINLFICPQVRLCLRQFSRCFRRVFSLPQLLYIYAVHIYIHLFIFPRLTRRLVYSIYIYAVHIYLYLFIFPQVRLCLRQFARCFRRVFYVPGNHDMWIRPKGAHSDEPSRFADSVAKLLALWQLCDENGASITPTHDIDSVCVCVCVCVCSVWVPWVALPSGGGSSVGSSPLCGSPVGGVPLLSCPRSMWHLLA